jgi:hypothetical protein
VPSSSGLWEPCLGMLTSKDCCASNAAGTERSVGGEWAPCARAVGGVVHKRSTGPSTIRAAKPLLI